MKQLAMLFFIYFIILSYHVQGSFILGEAMDYLPKKEQIAALNIAMKSGPRKNEDNSWQKNPDGTPFVRSAGVREAFVTKYIYQLRNNPDTENPKLEMIIDWFTHQENIEYRLLSFGLFEHDMQEFVLPVIRNNITCHPTARAILPPEMQDDFENYTITFVKSWLKKFFPNDDNISYHHSDAVLSVILQKRGGFEFVRKGYTSKYLDKEFEDIIQNTIKNKYAFLGVSNIDEVSQLLSAENSEITHISVDKFDRNVSALLRKHSDRKVIVNRGQIETIYCIKHAVIINWSAELCLFQCKNFETLDFRLCKFAKKAINPFLCYGPNLVCLKLPYNLKSICMHLIGDEIHFLNDCPKLKTIHMNKKLYEFVGGEAFFNKQKFPALENIKFY